MIDARARAVLDELERHAARERERDTPRAGRLRQVTPEVGRFLHTLVLATRPRSIVEIGTSGGYSTVWLAPAARAVGGSGGTLGINPAKVRRGAGRRRRAGGADRLRLLGRGEGGLHGVPGADRPPAAGRGSARRR